MIEYIYIIIYVYIIYTYITSGSRVNDSHNNFAACTLSGICAQLNHGTHITQTYSPTSQVDPLTLKVA